MKSQPIYPDSFLRCLSEKDRPKGVAGMTAREAVEVAEARSEKHLQQQLEQLLLRRGHLPRRQRMDRKSQLTIGTPDIQFEVYGQSVHWEVKYGAGKTTPEQDRMISGLRAAPNGAIVRVIRSYREGLDHLQEATRTAKQMADLVNDPKTHEQNSRNV